MGSNYLYSKGVVKKRRFSATFILLISITFFLFFNIAQARAQCKLMLIADSSSGGYLKANPINKIMGCDFYKPLHPLQYAGAVVKWYYSDSVAGPLDFWRYTEQGTLQEDLYAGADYVIYAIGNDDVGIMLNCGNDNGTKGYPDNDTLIADHDNFITDVLIGKLGYKREQIVLFFKGPIPYSEGGDPAGTEWEDCRAEGITDKQCVSAMFDNSTQSGWTCNYTNRHLKLITRDFKNLATLRGMPFADMFTWTMNNYKLWNVMVSLIEEAILEYNRDVGSDGLTDAHKIISK